MLFFSTASGLVVQSVVDHVMMSQPASKKCANGWTMFEICRVFCITWDQFIPTPHKHPANGLDKYSYTGSLVTPARPAWFMEGVLPKNPPSCHISYGTRSLSGMRHHGLVHNGWSQWVAEQWWRTIDSSQLNGIELLQGWLRKKWWWKIVSYQPCAPLFNQLRRPHIIHRGVAPRHHSTAKPRSSNWAISAWRWTVETLQDLIELKLAQENRLEMVDFPGEGLPECNCRKFSENQ